MEDGNVFDDLCLGYIYAAPLLMMAATFGTTRNILVHKQTTGTSANRLVARPGVDTINTRVFLDLSSSPLVFQTPPSRTKRYPEGRFVSYELIDAYTNCVALFGTGFMNGDEGGTYLICGPSCRVETPKGMIRIDLPTNMAWLLCRSLMLRDEDLEEICSLQRQMSLYPLEKDAYVERVFPPFPAPPDEPLKMFFNLDPAAYFDLYNRLSLENLPYVYDAPVLKRLKSYGIGPGLDFRMEQFPKPLRTEIQDRLVEAAQQKCMERLKQAVMRNGWSYSEKNIAHFGTDYTYRALVAIVGIMANPVEVAMYLTAQVDQDGERLNGAHKYRIRFPAGATPPVQSLGFWSLTAYAEDQYLVANPYDRFRISCANAFQYNSDGSLDLIVQAQAPEDAGLFDNFLPCGEGIFDLCLRLYLPQQEAIDLLWSPPQVERADG